MEEAGFTTFTTASHHRANKKFGLHFWRAIVYGPRSNSQQLNIVKPDISSGVGGDQSRAKRKSSLNLDFSGWLTIVFYNRICNEANVCQRAPNIDLKYNDVSVHVPSLLLLPQVVIKLICEKTELWQFPNYCLGKFCDAISDTRQLRKGPQITTNHIIFFLSVSFNSLLVIFIILKQPPKVPLIVATAGFRP